MRSNGLLTGLASLHFHEAGRLPMSIPVEELEDYVVIKDNSEEIKESPYSHLELFWPVELCQNHVEVIDSPGLNESEVREQITLNYLRKVDAVIFVLTALRLGPSLHEKATLRTLRSIGHDEPFFVVNQFDLLQRERDRKAVTARAKEQFLPYTKRGAEQSIHFISALHALKGRKSTNPYPKLVQQLGFCSLKKFSTTFLQKSEAD